MDLETLSKQISEATEPDVKELLGRHVFDTANLRALTDGFVTKVRELLESSHREKIREWIRVAPNPEEWSIKILQSILDGEYVPILGPGMLTLILESIQQVPQGDLKNFLEALLSKAKSIKEQRREYAAIVPRLRPISEKQLPPAKKDDENRIKNQLRRNLIYLCTENSTAADPTYYALPTKFTLQEIIACMDGKGEVYDTRYKIKLITDAKEFIIISWDKQKDKVYYRLPS